jgi:ATP-dependent protease HslVU (ClpYQ) peptidase subunit
MTVIACKVSKGFIEIASDSQTTWGQNKYPTRDKSDKHISANGKVFSVNGITVGCAGNCAHIGLFQNFCKTHSPKEMSSDSIIDWIIEFKDWVNDKTKIAFDEISLHGIIVKDGKAFTFFDHLESYEIKDFFAVGSGMFLAIGAMDSGADVTQAVKTAMKYDLFCGGTVNYLKI